MRPDRYLKIAAAMRREGMGITVGFAGAAQRCPDRPGLIDELGTLTWRQLDERINALAAALQGLPLGQPKAVGIMCRNHRGFVGALVAANRIGSDIVLLNTSFAGPALAEVVNREGVDAVIYNATEAGMIATATPEDLRAAPDTAGRPAGGTEIRILDGEFNELPTGEVGTIYVRNDTQFDGYTSGTTKDFHAGFMSSGDVGYLDDAGRLFVVGRDDEMIVSGGENVYPIEVEKTLAAHPEVAEAAVIGVDDEQYGQRLAAFVVLTPGAGATPDTLKQHVRENLANYKAPREITVLDELPRGSTGKVLRNELQSRVGGA